LQGDVLGTIKTYEKIFEEVQICADNTNADNFPCIENSWLMCKADALVEGGAFLFKEGRLGLSCEWIFSALVQMKLSFRREGWPSEEYIEKVDQM
jgi:hypothetical protein